MIQCTFKRHEFRLMFGLLWLDHEDELDGSNHQIMSWRVDFPMGAHEKFSYNSYKTHYSRVYVRVCRNLSLL